MKSRRGIGVLVACGLVFGLMAISASGAQAAAWMVGGTNVTSNLSVGIGVEIEPLGEKKEKHLVLLTTSGGNKVEILCSKVVVTSATLKAGGVAEGTLDASECTTSINGTPEPNCDPLNQPIENGGTIEVVKHNGVTYAKATGAGGVFAELLFDEEECVALPEKVKITGTGWIEDCNGEFEEELSVHLIQEAMVPALALGGLFFGANAAEIHGSVNIELTDKEHEGKAFNGLG